VTITHLEKEETMTQQLFLISDVARQLGVANHRIAYLYMTRKLPEPALKLGNRRIFTLDDVRKIAKALGRGEQEAK
jgi:DNA-binding transcriptional MerR regulator